VERKDRTQVVKERVCLVVRVAASNAREGGLAGLRERWKQCKQERMFGCGACG